MNKFDAFQRALKKNFPLEQLHCDAGECHPYGYDNSRLHVPPIAVIFPHNEQDILTLVNLCNEYHIPITPRGRGTSTVGAAVPTPNGCVISFERMDNILEFDPDNRLMRVQPGVTNQAVQHKAAEANLFWAPDPSSGAYCTVGGNLAHNAAGPRAVKYATTRENTLGLRFITGDGKSLQTGVRTTKGVVGYDLTRLLIGSEGTLGLITEATLLLLPKPEKIHTYLLFFETVDSAILAVIRAMKQTVRPCALEFMDTNALTLARNFKTYDIPDAAGAALIVELDGMHDSIHLAEQKLLASLQGDGLIQLHIASEKTERDALWQTRRKLSPALRTLADTKINEDVVVPITALPELIAFTTALAQQYDLIILNFGHAGNGNLHVNILYNQKEVEKASAAQKALSEIFEKVLALGGTLSGEHGVGLTKKPFVQNELSIETLTLMKNIKQQFDPNNILNPDKNALR